MQRNLVKVLPLKKKRKNITINKFNYYNGYVYKFIEENPNLSYKELSEKLEKEFNIKINYKQLTGLCSFWEIKENRPKSINKNYKPIGTEYIRKNVVYIKFKDDKNLENRQENYMPKRRYIWEKYYGPIPNKHIIIHLDGDFTNCDIKNLRCISQNVYGKISKMYGLGIITDAMIEIAKLEEEIKEINNERISKNR